MADYQVGVNVTTKSDDAPLQKTREELGRFVKKGEEAKEKLGELPPASRAAGAAFDGLGSTLVGFLATIASVGVALGTLRAAFMDAVGDEKRADSFARAMRTLTGATDESVAAMLRWIDGAQVVSTVTEDKLQDAMKKFGAATGDSAAALKLTETALKLAKETGTDFSTTVDDMTRIMVTGQARGLDPLIVRLKTMMNGGMEAKDALKLLADQVDGAGVSADTSAERVERLRISWDETREAAGYMALALADKLQPALKFVGFGFGVLLGEMEAVADLLGTIARKSASYWEAAQQLEAGNISKGWAIIRENLATGKEDAERAFGKMSETVKSITTLWDVESAKQKMAANASAATAAGALDKIQQDAKDAAEKLAKAQAELAKTYRVAMDAATAAGTSEVDAARRVLEVLDRMAKDQRLDIDQRTAAEARAAQMRRQLEAQELKDAQHLADEKARSHKLLAQVLQDIRRENLEEEKKAAEEEKRILRDKMQNERRLESLERAFEHKTRVDELKEVRHNLFLELLAQGQTAEGIKRIKRDLANVEKEIDKEVTRTKIEGFGMVAQAAINAASGMFGNSKALAVAQSLLNAFMAAAGAAAETHGDVYTRIAAYVAALGYVFQAVTAIRGTEFKTEGAGFDDPENDAQARLGGLRWARDMVREFSAGVSRGWAEGMGQATVDRRVQNQSTVNDNRRSSTVINAPMQVLTGAQARQAHRQLEWSLRKARVLNDRKAAASSAVRVGRRV